jgi:hypothetical protein
LSRAVGLLGFIWPLRDIQICLDFIRLSLIFEIIQLTVSDFFFFKHLDIILEVEA